jgi:hypothetical protein
MFQAAKDNVNQVNSSKYILEDKKTVDKESNNSKSDIEIKQEDKHSGSFQNATASNSMKLNEKQESDSRSLSLKEPDQKK